MVLWLSCGSCFDHLACFCTQILGLFFLLPLCNEKNSHRRPLKLSVRNCTDEQEAFGSLQLEIVIMQTLSYLEYWEHAFKTSILSAVIKKEYSLFSWIMAILLEKIFFSQTSETNNGFCLYWNLKQNLFFKYFRYAGNLMASFFCISLSSTQPKREFTNQHHMKYRPSSGCALVSLCLSHNVSCCEIVWIKHVLSWLMHEGCKTSLAFTCHLSFVRKGIRLCCKELCLQNLQTIFRNMKYSVFCQAKSKSLPCNANPNIDVWDKKEVREKEVHFSESLLFYFVIENM